LRLIAGNAHPALARAIGHELDTPAALAEVGAFADGETRIHIDCDVRDADVVLVQPTGPPVNEHLMVLALLADAVRAAGAARVTALVPYFGYARQDRRARWGDPRSAQVAARLLPAVGVEHLIVLDLHTDSLESAFPMPVTLLHGDEVFLPRVRAWSIADLTVVSPDAGGLKRAQRYAAALGAPLAVIAKDRPKPDVVAPLHVLGDVKGRTCLIVDDMASTGRTMAAAAGALRYGGAREVHALFSHAVMAPGAADLLANTRFGKVLTTDSIPVDAPPWMEVVPVSAMLARTIRLFRGEK
jgi:ribose-phosphate pyrophosphokinase